MKDIYNRAVYYLFSLMLFCAPTRLSAEEFAEADQKARQQKTQEERPVGESPAPTAPPPPPEEKPASQSFTIPETTVTAEQELPYRATEVTTAVSVHLPNLRK